MTINGKIRNKIQEPTNEDKFKYKISIHFKLKISNSFHKLHNGLFFMDIFCIFRLFY